MPKSVPKPFRKRLALLVAASVAGVGAALLAGLRRRVATRRPRPAGWPVNLAHRGASWDAPENTLEAFALGVEAGAGGLEMDAHLTMDGEVVVIHDPTVDRTTDGTGNVAEMTLAELQRLDAGYRFGAERGFPYRGLGLRVPTLREVYERFPGVAINIEIKAPDPALPAALLKVIEEAGAEERTLVASMHHRPMRRFRQVSGGRVATSASKLEISTLLFLSKLRLESLAPVEYVALQVPVRSGVFEVVTPRFIVAAHSRGAGVDVWTINEAAEMRRLLDLGANVVMSDRPDVLSRVIEEFEPGGS